MAVAGKSISVRFDVQRGGRTVEVAHQDFGTVVKFLAYAGLRWGEMAALKVGSFDMLRRRVNITEAVAEVKGHMVWDTPKGHERRSVPFPAFRAEPMAALRERASRSAPGRTSDDHLGDFTDLIDVQVHDQQGKHHVQQCHGGQHDFGDPRHPAAPPNSTGRSTP